MTNPTRRTRRLIARQEALLGQVEERINLDTPQAIRDLAADQVRATRARNENPQLTGPLATLTAHVTAPDATYASITGHVEQAATDHPELRRLADQVAAVSTLAHDTNGHVALELARAARIRNQARQRRDQHIRDQLDEMRDTAQLIARVLGGDPR